MKRWVVTGGAATVLAVLLGAIALVGGPSWARAATWYSVAEVGQQQQFVDLDSVTPLGRGQVRVSSYYVDGRSDNGRSGEPQRTTYLTEYDCAARRFRDVVFDGSVGSSTWLPVAPDPLNRAAMEYVCAIAGGG